jgi:hypothetical protein
MAAQKHRNVCKSVVSVSNAWLTAQGVLDNLLGILGSFEIQEYCRQHAMGGLALAGIRNGLLCENESLSEPS